MKKSNTSTLFKSYILEHKSNPGKVDSLFDLYKVYQSEYKFHMTNYWTLFTKNQINNNKFSHLGSTKHIKTQLNSAYLQCLLSQVCASLNNYTANIATKFSDFINHSSIKDKDLLHKLRTINSKHAWLNQNVTYYTNLRMDDYGFLFESNSKHEVLIEKSVLRLARKIFNHIVDKDRVRFPNINKPRLLIDDRLYSLEPSKTSTFDYWLKITTLTPGKRIAIPINKNTYFNLAKGSIGKSIELDFKSYDYSVVQHKYNSLSKGNGKKLIKHKFNKVNKQVRFIFNKKIELDDYFNNLNQINTVKDKTVAFDLGLCNFIATSDGELYGQYWLYKLKQYDEKINELFSHRQYCLTNYNKKNPTKKIKIRSKRYDNLINQVRGFIKTETNRILNQYFDKHQDIKTVVIEKLRFSSPELSKRLNRIIQNFGYSLFKSKLEELSLFYGYEIVELNPAYTSQECSNCGYVAKNNRKSQSEFRCECCGHEKNADVQSSRTNLKRFEDKQGSAYKALHKGTILRKVKFNFSNRIEYLISNGIVGRRNLYKLLKANKYFQYDIREIVRTTEASGVKPITVKNYDKYLKEYLSIIPNKI
jgi:putative transposase